MRRGGTHHPQVRNFLDPRAHTVVAGSVESEAAKPWGYAPQSVAATARTVVVLPMPSQTVVALLWAGVASTLHRVRRGEGALLAVNLSLIACQGLGGSRGLAIALVSVL